MTVEAASLVAVVLAGLLAGSELTSWGIVHPVLWKLQHAEQVRAEKLMYRRFASVDPFLMTATVIACFVAAGRLDGTPASLALAAGGCFATMLAITLLGNMPLNLRVLPLGRGPRRPRGMAVDPAALGSSAHGPRRPRRRRLRAHGRRRRR